MRGGALAQVARNRKYLFLLFLSVACCVTLVEGQGCCIFSQEQGAPPLDEHPPNKPPDLDREQFLFLSNSLPHGDPHICVMPFEHNKRV